MKHKTTVRAFLLFAVLVLISLLVVGLDFSKYRSGINSNFFGSKDTYTQDQPLYFNDLKVKVASVEHKRYDYQTYDGCMKIAEAAGSLMRANNFIKTDEWELLSSESKQCVEMAELYENKKMLVVRYDVENISTKPLDTTPYTIKIVGDEKSESTQAENKITTLLASQSRPNSFVIHHLNKNQNGPFALVVERSGKQKQIQITLPELTAFCNNSICSTQVFDR